MNSQTYCYSVTALQVPLLRHKLSMNNRSILCSLFVSASILLATILSFNVQSTSHSKNTDLVAYYQTNGKHMVATKEVIHLFKRLYPPEQIHMHNDGGPSLLRAIAHLNGIRHYTYDRSSGCIAQKEGMYFISAQTGTAYLERLSNVARAAPWVLLLEDDVWLHSAINTEGLIYDINGECKAHFNEGLANFVRPPVSNCYGGCGGMVVRSSRLLRANISTAMVDSLIKASDKHNIASDELLSAVILLAGGTIGPMEGYFESNYYLGTNPVVQHQAKALY